MPMPRGAQQRAAHDPGMKPLRLTMGRLGPATLEAWKRILHAYSQRHPLHQTRLYYHHQPVPDLKEFARHVPQIDPRGFEVQLRCPDGDEAETGMLLALMAEAAGPRGKHFLSDADPAVWFTAHPPVAGTPQATGAVH